MKSDQQCVSTLLLDTVTLLCRNGLAYKNKLTIQGLIGITIDDSDVFIVHINENVIEQECGNDDEHSKTPQLLSETAAGKPLQNQQLVESSTRVPAANAQNKNGKVSNHQKRLEILYDQGALGSSSANDDVIDIKSEGEEEEELDNSFTQTVSHCSLTVPSDNSQFGQMYGTNTSTYCKQEFHDGEGRTENGAFETVRPKLEVNYNFNTTCNYATFSGNAEQVLDGLGEGDQLDYDAIGEDYAEDEEDQEEDEKPAPDTPSASFSSWGQQNSQFAFNHHTLPVKRAATFGQRSTMKRRRPNTSNVRFSQRGFSHVGHRLPHLQRHPPAISSLSLKAAESVSTDETIKTMTTFICNIDGCTSSFTLKSNLLRHQTNKHGREKKQRRTISDVAALYGQIGQYDDDFGMTDDN